MQIKFLKSVVENLINKQAVPIIDLLIGKKDVNEFLIAKKLNLTINQARNILYKLSDYGLVSFIRKKDKKKGWYIYFWTLNIYQSLNLLQQNLKKELEQLEFQLRSRREKRFYICNTCSIEVSEEAALINDFTCPECEEIYKLSDNREVIQQLEKDINKIRKEIQMVSVEKDKEEQKLEKEKVKKIQRAERKRREIRKKARKKREPVKKARKKIKKKPIKKIKKKPAKKAKKTVKRSVKKAKKKREPVKKKLAKKVKKKIVKKVKKKPAKKTSKKTSKKIKKRR